jgi:outer membrane beta-barrel protein
LKRTSATLLAVLLLPLGAWGQAGFGLDLNDPSEGQGDQGGMGLDLSGESSSTPAEVPTAPPPDRKPATKTSKEDLLTGERDVTVEDRVKSVQRKLYLKKSRFELSPSLSYAVNDPYYLKYGAALRGAWYLADNLAVAGRFALMDVQPNQDVRTAKRAFQSQIFYSVPQWAAMGDIEWSPIYGKLAIWNDILHLDAYLLGGLGVVTTETSAQVGPNPAADLGGGLRVVARDYLAVNAALINTYYVDAPRGTTRGNTQNIMTLNLGISVFFPFKSSGREGE